MSALQGTFLWTQDYPRADRHFAQPVRRLTRLDVRSVAQSVNLEDSDDVYNLPWLYVVQVGEWGLTEAQATVSVIICCSAASLSRRWSRFSRRQHAVCSNRSTKRRRRFPRLAIQRCGPDAARSPAPPGEEAARISRPFPSAGVATLFWKRLRRSPHVGELARKQRVLRRMGSGNCATASTSTGPIAQPQSTNASIDPDERSLRRSTLTIRRCPAGAAPGSPTAFWETRGKPLRAIAT